MAYQIHYRIKNYFSDCSDFVLDSFKKYHNDYKVDTETQFFHILSEIGDGRLSSPNGLVKAVSLLPWAK